MLDVSMHIAYTDDMKRGGQRCKRRPPQPPSKGLTPMTATTGYRIEDLKDRGLYVGARVGSTVRPNLLGTVCAVRMGGEYLWVTFDGGLQDLVSEHEICSLGLRDDDMSDELEDVV
jgi:hypothetical protein